jgi:hypothetical protein
VTASVSGTSNPAVIEVPVGKELAAIASTKDPGGASSIKLIFVSGGLFRDETGTLTSTVIKTNTTSNGTAFDWAAVGARLVPDSPGTDMVIRAEGEDFAGNVVPTATITFVQKPLPEARIDASNRDIDRGQSTTIFFETDHADEALLNGVLLGTFNGSRIESPQQSTTYELEARSTIGSDKNEVFVRVIPPPSAPQISQFNASPTFLDAGQLVTLTWDTSNATDVTIRDGGDLVVANAGATGTRNEVLTSLGDHVFELTATGPGGTTIETDTVRVGQPAGATPSCVDTCSGDQLICFNKIDNLVDNGVIVGSLWRMNLSIHGLAIGLGNITSITNKTGHDMLLDVDGDVQPILAGQTSTSHAGQTAHAIYVAAISHPAQAAILGPRIEICHQ